VAGNPTERGIDLMSANERRQKSEIKLKEPRIENGKALLIAGLRRRYTAETMNRIPDQWTDFIPHVGNVPGDIHSVTYGLSFLGRGAVGIEYLSGVEVSNCGSISNEFSCVRIPAQRYAVFTHREHVSRLWETCNAIQTQWFPDSGHEPVRPTGDAPDFFERYSESFDPNTGTGGIEVWVPIKS